MPGITVVFAPKCFGFCTVHLRRILGSFGASTCILWHFSLRIRGALAAIHNALMRITCAFATSVALAQFGLTSDARVCAQNAHRCVHNTQRMQWDAVECKRIPLVRGVCILHAFRRLPDCQHAFLCIHSAFLCIPSAFLRIHDCLLCKRRARCKHECHPRHPLSPLWLVCGWHSSGTAHPVRIHAHSKRMRLNA